MLGVRGNPTFIHRKIFEKAIPQYNVGYGRFKKIMDTFEEKAPGVFIAGNFRTGISLSDCISEAEKLAKKLFSANESGN